jgi:predicted DsbA family dithiol-disulfide isomerase
LWADARGKGPEFRGAVYRAYFARNANIGSADVLAAIATELGLDEADLRQALAEQGHRQQVLSQFERARQIGVTAVPTFVASGYALVGAHPLENFRKLMELAAANSS